MKPLQLILTCEHAVNTIPLLFQSYFKNQESILQSHQGYDIGAQLVAETIHQYLKKQNIDCPYIKSTVSRLLVDCNRSPHSPTFLSQFTQHCTETEKQFIKQNYYDNFRQAVYQTIADAISRNYQVLHISIHSFTPYFNNTVRHAALGLLYDPTRHGEREVAREWRRILLLKKPFRIRMNYPYQGTSDGLTQTLRHQWPEKEYLGFELEINQALLQQNNPEQADLAQQVTQILAESIQNLLEVCA